MIGQILVGIVCLIYCFYTVVPNYYVRNRMSEVPHRLPKVHSGHIALTFDDGPDPRYTPQILDILKKHDVKATFFMVATRVLEAPEVVNKMVAEGHQVALHSYAHRSAWLSTPIQTLSEFEKALAVIENYAPPIKWFRPPWGTFNVMTLLGARRKGLKTALWSVEAFDWKANRSGNAIYEEVIRRTKSGDIIVLHDAGGADGAPQNTVDALEPILIELKRHYTFVTLEEGLRC